MGRNVLDEGCHDAGNVTYREVQPTGRRAFAVAGQVVGQLINQKRGLSLASVTYELSHAAGSMHCTALHT